MPLITILLVLVVVGVVLWLINSYIPMDNKIRRIINIVVVIIVVIWLLKVFGLFAYLTSIHV
ncbi:MAG: Thivi_2564 family membrane protein [Bacteroidota bacterium]